MAKPQIADSTSPDVQVQLAALSYYPGKRDGLSRKWPHGHFQHVCNPGCTLGLMPADVVIQYDIVFNLFEGDEMLAEAIAELKIAVILPEWDYKENPFLLNPFLSGPQKFEIMASVLAASERTSLWPDSLTQISPRG